MEQEVNTIKVMDIIRCENKKQINHMIKYENDDIHNW